MNETKIDCLQPPNINSSESYDITMNSIDTMQNDKLNIDCNQKNNNENNGSNSNVDTSRGGDSFNQIGQMKGEICSISNFTEDVSNGDNSVVERTFLFGKLDEDDIFDAIADVKDPELPNTLEELNVVQYEHVKVDQTSRVIQIGMKPTVKHCAFVSHISLCIRCRLQKRFCLETLNQYKLEFYLHPNSHNNEREVNRQINDKERVAAAMENPHLMQIVQQCAAEQE